MSFIRLEFSHDNEFMGASVQTDNHLTPPSPGVKIGKINGKEFLNKFYKREPITLKNEQGDEFQIDIEEVLDNFVNGEDEILYLIFNGDADDDLCAVWEYYDEEEIYRRNRVFDICTIRKFEMMIAAEDYLYIEAQSVINDFDTKTVSGSDILNCYNSMDGDNADNESEYGASEPVPPSWCPHPRMCYNYEYDPDMCDKCSRV